MGNRFHAAGFRIAIVTCRYGSDCRNSASTTLHGYILASGYILLCLNVACIRRKLYACAGSYSTLCRDVACVRRKLYAFTCLQVVVGSYNTLLHIRSHTAAHVNRPLKRNIADIVHCHGQVMVSQCLACYVNASVIGMQRQVMARNQLAVLGNHQVGTSLFVLVVGVHHNIACHGGSPSVNSNRAIYRLQGHVLLRLHRINGRTVVTHMDAPRIRLQGYAAFIGSNRFHNINIACASGNRHVLFCGYASRSIAAYCNITRAGFNRNLFAGGDILAHGNGTVLRLHGYIFGHSDVFIHYYITLSTGLRIKAVARSHLIRHMDIAVFRYQGSVMAGRHLAVLVNDDALSGVTCHILIVCGQ